LTVGVGHRFEQGFDNAAPEKANAGGLPPFDAFARVTAAVNYGIRPILVHEILHALHQIVLALSRHIGAPNNLDEIGPEPLTIDERECQMGDAVDADGIFFLAKKTGGKLIYRHVVEDIDLLQFDNDLLILIAGQGIVEARNSSDKMADTFMFRLI